MTVDEEGYLWWPLGEEEKWVDGAKKVFEIEISFSYVSSVAFGDKENTIYNFSK